MAAIFETIRQDASRAKPKASLPASNRAGLSRAATSVLLPLAGFVLRELAVRFGWASGRLIPAPSRIVQTLWSLAITGELFHHLTASALRVLVGFVAGAAAGTLIGVLTGYFTTLRRLLDPSFQAIRAIPSIAWVPLFILWFGIFETSKIVLIATGVFFPVYLGVSTALREVDRKIVEVGKIFRLSSFELVWRILFPAVLPSFVVSLRAGLGLGWMFVVAAEFMGASEGLGYLLVDGQQLGKPDQIIAAILAFAVLGKLSDALLVALTAPLLRWQDAYGEDQL